MPFMPYSQFVRDIADEVNRRREEQAPQPVEGEDVEIPLLSEQDVREVLDALSVGFIEMTEGDMVKAPFGVFTMTRQRGREVALPVSGETAWVNEKLIVKLRPGKRLHFPVPGTSGDADLG